jgi:hypothetical protein
MSTKFEPTKALIRRFKIPKITKVPAELCVNVIDVNQEGTRLGIDLRDKKGRILSKFDYDYYLAKGCSLTIGKLDAMFKIEITGP